VILFVVAMFWSFSATEPAHFLMVAIAIILRIMYITGKSPHIPLALLIFWVLALALTFALAGSSGRLDVFMMFCRYTLLGTLLLHVVQQTSAIGVLRRIPYVRQVALLLSRAVVLLKKSIFDMLFLSRQNTREVAAVAAHRSWPVRNALVFYTYVSCRGGLALSAFQECRALVDRWTTVVSARGEFPAMQRLVYTEPLARQWYANLGADLCLIGLLVLPVLSADSRLVPPRILEIVGHISVTGVQ
jgi:hypothetical protein